MRTEGTDDEDWMREHARRLALCPMCLMEDDEHDADCPANDNEQED